MTKHNIAENAAKQYDYSLLAPGPVNLHPRVRQALSLPMIHHRTPEFDKILARVLLGLKKIFQTEQAVYMHSSTGSGGMESLLVNVLSPGDKVITIVSGKFGERWSQMASAIGAQVIDHNVPWGEAVRSDDIRTLLKQHPDARAVLCQACETSTGVVHPIQELANLIAPLPKTLFLVDAITALGAFHLPMDQWKIDGLVAGSQKALMLPTGLSFVSFSKKAEAFFDQATTPRYYFDIRREKKANSTGETFFSSSVSLVRALDAVLNLIEEQGLPQLFHSIHRRAEATRIFSQKLGFSLYAKTPSDSVTALVVPAGTDGQKIRLYLEENYNITIMGGQDQAKGKIIRIGHMGYIHDEELLRLIECLGKTCQHFMHQSLSDAHIQSVIGEMKSWLETHP
ncbi:MAG: alanine--glyoxylate aminotransferase family protein [Bdellovibrionaceae bacterium]|nr:alanine--glyoxylate aminotransferase family protein [Pseudobdellovibrionaceae bacterium]